MDLSALSTSLRADGLGGWVSCGDEQVRYPAEGNDFCFAVEDRSFWFQHRCAAVLAAFRRLPPVAGPFFDVGAGNGQISAALSAIGVETVAIEPNPRGASNALARGIKHVVRSRLETARFHAECAGGVGLFDVLEHVPDERSLLAEIRRCLAPGGRLYVTVPAYPSLWSAEDDLAGHCRRYTRRSLANTLMESGLLIDFTSYLFWWLPLPIVVKRTLPTRLGAGRHATAAPSPTEHTLGGPILRRLATLTLAIELVGIRHGWPVGFGASCLAVARRPAK